MKTELINALLSAKNGDWETAHQIAQSKEGNPDYDRLHALLHRIEGDTANAKYWYSICNMPVYKGSIELEIEELMAIFGG